MKKYLLVLFIILVFSSLAFGQSITLNNIGMYVDALGDQTGSDGETVHVRVDYTTSLMDNVQGPHYSSSNHDKIRILWYSANTPTSGTYLEGAGVTISNWSSGGIGTNKIATFTFNIPSSGNPAGAQSFQVLFGLYGEDENYDNFDGTRYTSYITYSSTLACSGNPPANYYEYIIYSTDTSTEAPTLDLPLANATVPTDFTLQYDQPETAYPNTVKITITRTTGSLDSGSPHVLLVESEVSGTNKTINIKGGGLGGATGVSLYSGGNTLVDDAVYTIRIEYQDLAQNTAAWDENDGIFYDVNELIELVGGDYNAGTSFSPGSTNNAFFRIQMNKTGSGQNATVDSIYFDITGNFDGSDIDAIRIWKSSNSTFESSLDTLLISNTSSLFDPFIVEFSPSQIISTTTFYYFLTVDVSSSAVGTDAIGATIDYATWLKASLTVSGTFPISGSTHPLPVTLSSFTVVLSGQPVIYWTTQSETNNAYWNIYRGISQNLGQAIQINDGDMILGQGTSTEPTDYSYIDNYPILENTTYWYWLECVDNAGEADILGPVSLFVPEGNGNNGTPATPDDYGLKQNYPNPFNPDTKINFALVEDSPVRLTIYNIKGEKIKTIFDDFVSADMVQTAYWDGKDESGKKVASGVYLYRLRTNKTEFNRRMLLMK